MAEERADLIRLAKLTEKAQRYDDMASSMRKATQIDGNLNDEERNLLSVGYKNIVGARRTSRRILSSLEQKEKEPGKQEFIRSYKKEVEEELKSFCYEVLELIRKWFIPQLENAESKVFFHKMKGDYCRYLAEVNDREDQKSDREVFALESREAYEKAIEAGVELANANPIKLELALNFSALCYEILKLPKEACELAKHAFDKAIADLEHVREESYKESTLIMQLLRDNLTLWLSENKWDEEADNKQ